MRGFMTHIDEFNNAIKSRGQEGAILNRKFISKITGTNNSNTLTADIRYNSGIIEKIKRGVYSIGRVHPFTVANKIISPSYISLEKVLSSESLIPEYIPMITSITIKNGTDISNRIGNFNYRHVGEQIFFGFHVDSEGNLVADPEKAILDYIYLNGDLFTVDAKIFKAIDNGNKTYLEDNLFMQFRSMRFQNLDKLDWEKLDSYAERIGKIKTQYVSKALKLWMGSDSYDYHI